VVRDLMLGTDLAGGCESSDIRPPSLSMEESSAKVSLISRGDKPDLEKGEVTPTEEPEGGERLAGTNRHQARHMEQDKPQDSLFTLSSTAQVTDTDDASGGLLAGTDSTRNRV